MKVAFFDFDGTITKKDSLIDFIIYAVGWKNFVKGMVILLPILILYKIKIISNHKAKQEMLSIFFKDMSKKEFVNLASSYSLNYIDKIVKVSALEKLDWHKQNNHKIVIVSASIDSWLRPWCEKNQYELIATKIEFKNNIVTGKLSTKNCYGQEKNNRIEQKYQLVQFDYVYAYGDSKGDKEMLKLANEAYYKYFKE